MCLFLTTRPPKLGWVCWFRFLVDKSFININTGILLAGPCANCTLLVSRLVTFVTKSAKSNVVLLIKKMFLKGPKKGFRFRRKKGWSRNRKQGHFWGGGLIIYLYCITSPYLPPVLIISADHLQDVASIERQAGFLAGNQAVVQWVVVEQRSHKELQWRTNNV